MSDQLLTFADYPVSIPQPEFRDRCAELLMNTLVVVSGMWRRYGFTSDMPKFYIDTGEHGVNGESSPKRCIVYEDALYYCLRMYAPAPLTDLFRQEIEELHLSCDDISYFVQELTFFWMACHEAVHSLRQHESVLAPKLIELPVNEQGPQLKSLRRAFEYDADLCAVSEIFRVSQFSLMLGRPDIETRKFTIAIVYWAARGLQPISAGAEHISWPGRVWDMAMKIASLWADPHDRRSPVEHSNPDFSENLSAMTEFLVVCEREYRRNYPEKNPEFYDQFRAYGMRHSVPHRDQWESIRAEVADASGSFA